jgi:hypothetical protein
MYKFRATKDGKVLADKRETLTRIVDRFGLHIDSPLTVLTQDQARSFLQASDPSSLYKVRHHLSYRAKSSSSYREHCSIHYPGPMTVSTSRYGSSTI